MPYATYPEPLAAISLAGGGGWGSGPFSSWNSGDRASGSGEWGSGTLWGFDASRVVPVATENRPINRSVIYLIRAK